MNDYAPQMIVKTPSPCHVLATQNSTEQTLAALNYPWSPSGWFHHTPVVLTVRLKARNGYH